MSANIVHKQKFGPKLLRGKVVVPDIIEVGDEACQAEVGSETLRAGFTKRKRNRPGKNARISKVSLSGHLFNII